MCKFFTGRMPFLPLNQQCQSTEGNYAGLDLRPQNAGVGLAIGGSVLEDCGLCFDGDGLGYGLSVDTRSIVVITACGAVACICSWTATHSWPKYSIRSLTRTSRPSYIFIRHICIFTYIACRACSWTAAPSSRLKVYLYSFTAVAASVLSELRDSSLWRPP